MKKVIKKAGTPKTQPTPSLDLIKQWKELLRKNRLSVTQARLDLLTMLYKSKSPLSVADISKALLSKCPDQTTLYRSIQSLLKTGLLNSVDLGDRLNRYEYSKINSTAHHHHVTCRSCGLVTCVDLCLDSTLIQKIEKLGFQKIQHQLSFQAECQNCYG